MAKNNERADSESSKKKKMQQAYPAQLLSEITVTRARAIASQLKIPNYGKLVKDSLIPLIREQLALVEECEACGGGPCFPDDHQFPATDPSTSPPAWLRR